MTELKPCPFCGGEAETVGDDCMEWIAECVECCASSMAFATEAEAIAAWNTRAERTVYIVETYDDLLEGPYVEPTCYTKKEDAIRRCESQTYTDEEDGLRHWAHWTELRVVGE